MIEPGDKVRVKGRKRTAAVVESWPPLSQAPGLSRTIKLDRPLCGFKWWSESELEIQRKRA